MMSSRFGRKLIVLASPTSRCPGTTHSGPNANARVTPHSSLSADEIVAVPYSASRPQSSLGGGGRTVGIMW